MLYTARVQETVDVKRSWVSALPWAVYLGASWTWCIGMFLPVLLVRDFGVGGFWVFAVPNVLGAAAMGFVLRDAQDSRRMVERHRGAMVGFSLVTILFHVFFAAWMIRLLLGEWTALVVVGWMLVVWGIMRAARGGERVAAVGVYVMSMVAALVIWQRGNVLAVPRPAEVPAENLLGLAAVCILGFTLCPYLDLTFHRARQENDARGARVAFGVGFGVFFLAMILFTLAYGGVVLPMVEPRVAVQSAGVRLAQIMVGVHMAVQAAFTMVAHANEMSKVASKWEWFTLPVVALGASAGGVFLSEGGMWMGIDRGEFVYRLFLPFYGLLFPAYLWICGGSKVRRLDWVMFASTVIAAAPVYYAGFIRGQMAWVILGVIVVAAVGLVRRRQKLGLG